MDINYVEACSTSMSPCCANDNASASSLPPPSVVLMKYLMELNLTGVACMHEGRDGEALQLFQQGLNLCGVDICRLGQRLAAFKKQQCSQQPQPSCTETSCFLPSVSTFNSPPLQFLQSVNVLNDARRPSVTLEQQQQNNDYELYSGALLFNLPTQQQIELCPWNTSTAITTLLFQHHIGPLLLYNTALLLHIQSVSTQDFYLAHEVYRMSLFLMEENILGGLYHKGFDLLLLALFNNLSHLNNSFYLRDRVALCREKLMMVLIHSDIQRIGCGNYVFFYEQLVYSANLYPPAAPAA